MTVVGFEGVSVLLQELRKLGFFLGVVPLTVKVGFSITDVVLDSAIVVVEASSDSSARICPKKAAEEQRAVAKNPSKRILSDC